MKKTYSKPMTKVVEFQSEELICESIGIMKMNGNGVAEAGSRDFYDDDNDMEDIWQ